MTFDNEVGFLFAFHSQSKIDVLKLINFTWPFTPNQYRCILIHPCFTAYKIFPLSKNKYRISSGHHILIFYKQMAITHMAFGQSLYALKQNHQSLYVLQICAFSCTYIAKSGRQSFLCAYFFLQRLYVLIGHVLIKNKCKRII